MDTKGQIALEYLLIFFISIILLSIISIPLLTDSIETTTDISNTMETKEFMLELSNAAKIVHSSDYGTTKVIYVKCPTNLTLNYNSSTKNFYTSIKLTNGSRKSISIETPFKISFNNNPSFYYYKLNEGKYNAEIKWITSKDGEKCVDISFKKAK